MFRELDLLRIYFKSVYLVRAALLAAFLVFAGTALWGQTITTGDITGTVKDATGAVIPSATVALTNTDIGETRTATPNSSGGYRFSTLRPGHYEITADSPGLKSNTGRVQVAIGQVATVDLVLQPQASQTIVQVTESVPLVQSDNANLATTFTSHQLENLPAPGNDMTAYAFTAPGVTISTGAGYGNFSAFFVQGRLWR